MIKILITLCLTFSFVGFSKEKKEGKKSKQKVIYKYKSYERFDLGNLEIKGNVMAPGDLSVKDRARRTFSRELFDREDFNKEVIEEIKNLR